MKPNAQKGYTYFGLLFVIALIGLALTGASVVWQIEQQRDKERELLFVGQQYMNAIASYYHAAPGGNKKYPRTINDLLRDPRYPMVKRHLRRPWRDPLTLSREWGFVYTRQGGIAGIYSLAKGAPLKQAGFGVLEPLLSGKGSYQEWKFIYIAATDKSQDKGSGTPEQPNTEEAPMLQNQNENADDGVEETGAELLSPQQPQ